MKPGDLINQMSTQRWPAAPLVGGYCETNALNGLMHDFLDRWVNEVDPDGVEVDEILRAVAQGTMRLDVAAQMIRDLYSGRGPIQVRIPHRLAALVASSPPDTDSLQSVRGLVIDAMGQR